MRKLNSTIRTKFISEPGSRLQNKDYFAFVELDNYACYCLADSIDDDQKRISAQLAVESVIQSFTQHPSMSKRALKGYLREANRLLLEKSQQFHLKASMTIVVTNYVKVRFASAGNTRCQWYKEAKQVYQSKDHSLTRTLADKEQVPLDKMAQHEERHNLFRYLGQKDWFGAEISKKFKLANGDTLALMSRGIWENLDDGEIAEALEEAGEPQEILDGLEDLLLSRQPQNLDNYTFAFVFIDKIFSDPKKKQKIKRIIMIMIPILIVAIVVGSVVYVRYSKKQENIAAMQTHYLNTIEYIQDSNFITAQKECQKANELAIKVKDQTIKDDTNDYNKLLESIIKADEAMQGADYSGAYNDYMTAITRSYYSDNLAKTYLDQQLSLSGSYMQVLDLIYLGDVLAESGNLPEAANKYNEARVLASRIHFGDGKKQAMDALEKLYSDQKADNEDQDKETQADLKEELGAADFINQANQSFSKGDYEAAKLYYSMAKEKYIKLELPEEALRMDEKTVIVDEAIAQIKTKTTQAEDYSKQAEDYLAKGDSTQAIKYYLLAKAIYTETHQQDKADVLQDKITAIESGAAQAKNADAKAADDDAKADNQAAKEPEPPKEPDLTQ